MPYSQVYDAKGPFLYILFVFFAWLRPWSALPAMGFLALMTLASGWIVLRMAKERSASAGGALLAAVISLLIIYLCPTNVASSFTPEEVTITGVLLLLWLSTRWMRDPAAVRPVWWLSTDLFAAAAVLDQVHCGGALGGTPARAAGRQPEGSERGCAVSRASSCCTRSRSGW